MPASEWFCVSHGMEQQTARHKGALAGQIVCAHTNYPAIHNKKAENGGKLRFQLLIICTDIRQ